MKRGVKRQRVVALANDGRGGAEVRARDASQRPSVHFDTCEARRSYTWLDGDFRTPHAGHNGEKIANLELRLLWLELLIAPTICASMPLMTLPLISELLPICC